jgi:hypothetical protein
MSVDAKAEITIDRPRSEVAAVMFDPKCDKLWITGLTNVFPHAPGRLESGSKVERVGTFLGRNYSTVYQVTRAEDEAYAEIAADEPFQMKIRYELGNAGEGTLAKIRIQSIGEKEYQIPPSALNRAVQDWITGDLKRLKKRVEENHG